MARQRNQKSHVPTPAVSWINKLADEINVPFPPKGEEWYPICEIAKMVGKSHSVVAGIMKRKNAEVKRFTHIGIDGRKVVLIHYRMK